MISRKAQEITSFKVMDILERAKELEAQGKEIVHLEIGEPDFDTPQCVKAGALRALNSNETHYTHSLGLLELREAICEHYKAEYGVSIDPDQVLVTSGTSPAMLLIFSALLDQGDEVIVPEPYYPCYPNFIRFVGGVPIFHVTSPEQGFMPDPDKIKGMVSARTKALVINSPSNPTGQVIEAEVLRELASLGVTIISDEIYHGLTYSGAKCHSILEFTDNAFVLNGFSKRYAMTGWRLGYIIAPRHGMRGLQKLQQNFLISANSISQRAAIFALKEAGPDLEAMVRTYDERRSFMVSGLRELGFVIHVEPKGAFYVFCDASHVHPDSLEVSRIFLEEAGVAVTPGVEFGNSVKSFIRFSYANSLQNIQKGFNRLISLLGS